MAHGHEDFDRGISIDAQELGQVAVDIATQSLAQMNIDVVAQTVSNLDTNINAQSIGLELDPLYKIKQGKQKSFQGLTAGVADGSSSAVVDETIPAGETWYLIGFNGGVENEGVAKVALENYTPPSVMYADQLCYVGYGAYSPISPQIGTEGEDIRLVIHNFTGAAADVRGVLTIWYE